MTAQPFSNLMSAADAKNMAIRCKDLYVPSELKRINELIAEFAQRGEFEIAINMGHLKPYQSVSTVRKAVEEYGYLVKETMCGDIPFLSIQWKCETRNEPWQGEPK